MLGLHWNRLETTLLELTDLFVRSPGDFFYFVMMVLCLAGALGVASGQRSRHPQSRSANRYLIATAGALIGWFALFAGAVYARWSGQDAVAILPPLERAVTVVGMLLILWAFLTADSDWLGRLPGFVLVVLLVTVILGYVVTGLQWPLLAGTLTFNLSNLGAAWTFVQAVVALIGLVTTLAGIRFVVDAPLKGMFFLILLAGFGMAVWQTSQGDLALRYAQYSGVARLALFVAMPIVPFVVYRKVISGYERAMQATREQAAAAAAPSPPVKATGTASVAAVPPSSPSVTEQPLSKARIDPQSSPVERESVQLLRVLGMIMEESEPSEIPLRIVRAAVEVLKADVGALLSVKDANYADILVAYDRATQRPIPAMLSLNLEQQITLQNAIERKQQRPLYVDRNANELEDLYSRLDIVQLGPAYFQPLMRDDELIAILVVGMPFAKRELRDAERELLKGVGIISGSLLALSYAADDAMIRAEERAIQAMVAGVSIDEVVDDDVIAARQEMQSALDAAREQNSALQKQLAQLRIELDDERTRLTGLLGDTEEGLSITQRIVALNDDQERLRQERDQLARQLQEAETALAASTGTDNEAVFNSMIENLTWEKRDLEAELNSLRDQLAELRETAGEALPDTAQDVLEQMAREQERLQSERDRMHSRLSDIETQLEAMGFEEGVAGLAQMVQHLYEQRSALQAKTDALKLERDALLNERKRFERRIRKEDEREAQLEAMEAEIRHLAADREAITRQRDQIRSERGELANKIDKMKAQRARLLADVSAYGEELKEAQERVGVLEQRLNDLMGERGALQSERDSLLAERRSLQNERDQLIARLDGDRDKIQQIGADAHNELKGIISEITAQRNQLEIELNQTQTALRAAQMQQARLRQQIESVSDTVDVQVSNPELLMNMVQDLRTPMTSVVGYIDLLVGESSGILNDMQRKFIQRISANIVRLETMLNDLIHITALDTGEYQLRLVPLNIVELLEDAITSATYQFREKDLTVQLDLDDDIPDMEADLGGVRQVVGQLLTNAYLVTPVGGQVQIAAHLADLQMPGGSTSAPAVHFSVADQGGGIADDDLSEVFVRRYRTENQLVDGLGDTGVGLSIAKALVEAHGGRMWLEPNPGTGTVFHVALPLNRVTEDNH